MPLLKDVKNYLKITWEDEDDSLQGIINRGQANLRELTGTTLDFEQEGQAKSLLLDYCRYAYNNALEYYESNFHKEILRLQLTEAVKNDAVTERSDANRQSNLSTLDRDLGFRKHN